MKAYLTKYALTEGIKEVYGSFGANGDFYREIGKIRIKHSGDDIHLTHESAVQRAEEMRLSEIERLQKEINRLENLKF